MLFKGVKMTQTVKALYSRLCALFPSQGSCTPQGLKLPPDKASPRTVNFNRSVPSESVQSFDDDKMLTATFRVAPTEGVSQYCASPVFLEKSMSKEHSSIGR